MTVIDVYARRGGALCWGRVDVNLQIPVHDIPLNGHVVRRWESVIIGRLVLTEGPLPPGHHGMYGRIDQRLGLGEPR